jgi:cell division transport system permease protein
MFTDTKRIIRSGFLNFWRNGFVSLASVLIITITLAVLGSLLFFNVVMEETLATIKEKVDVDVYFVTTAGEDEILSLKGSLEALPEVDQVEYTSRENALGEFRERHADDFLTLQALEELGENPLGASLNIRAKETSQYGSIALFLENQSALVEGADPFVDKVNYYQNKEAIDKLTKLISNAEILGFFVMGVLVFITVVITFNTIRLAIYTAREEISVMRLVGAGNKYIRGPFLVEGMIYGVFSAIIVLALFYPVTYYLGDNTEQFFGGINIFNYYVSNFAQVFLIMMGSGVALGVFSSYFAVRRYISKKYLKL